MTVKLPRNIGKLIPYYRAALTVWRTPCPTFNAKRGIVKYRKEFVCRIEPLYFKEKKEAGPYCKQFAFANVSQGRYDWSFAVEWQGVEHLHAKENLARPNNGHPCPRCGTMTHQGEGRWKEKELCEKCSKLFS